MCHAICCTLVCPEEFEMKIKTKILKIDQILSFMGPKLSILVSSAISMSQIDLFEHCTMKGLFEKTNLYDQLQRKCDFFGIVLVAEQ